MVVGVPGLIGAGARQVVLDGRAANPDKTLLVDTDEDVATEEEDRFARLDCAAIEDAGLFPPPPPPPPQDAKKIKPVISRICFTHVFMAIISLD